MPTCRWWAPRSARAGAGSRPRATATTTKRCGCCASAAISTSRWPTPTAPPTCRCCRPHDSRWWSIPSAGARRSSARCCLPERRSSTGAAATAAGTRRRPEPAVADASAGAVDHDGLAARVQLAVGLQLLQHAAGHLARTADQACQLLARDAQLGALRVGHGIRLAGQVVQGAHDAVGHVQEGEAAGLAAGGQQSPRQLHADRVQQARRVGRQRAEHQLLQALVADFGELAGRARAQDDLAAVGLDEQPHLADELARAVVAQHQLATVFFLGDDADRAVDDVIEGAGRVAGPEHVGPVRVAAALAMDKESVDDCLIQRERAAGEAHWRHGGRIPGVHEQGGGAMSKGTLGGPGGQTRRKCASPLHPLCPIMPRFPSSRGMTAVVKPLPRLRLRGFNNLSKALSFNIYDVCYAVSEDERQRYIEYIDEAHNADRLTQILTDVASIIGANILNVARQDYDP